MAVPASFDESNAVLGRPPDMTDEQCGPLSIARATDTEGLPLVISCWKLTQAELDEVNRTGRIWLGIVGITMPPAWIAGNNPFPPAPKPSPPPNNNLESPPGG
jgi:hypothetical protein